MLEESVLCSPESAFFVEILRRNALEKRVYEAGTLGMQKEDHFSRDRPTQRSALGTTDEGSVNLF